MADRVVALELDDVADLALALRISTSTGSGSPSA
jgi:hypothetical protein